MWQPLVLIIAINIIYGRAESSCTTPNGEKARCIPLISCVTLKSVVYNTSPDPSQKAFLKASVCGHDGRTPLICCGNYTRFFGLLPDRSQCGFQLSYKVLGGNNTELGEVPWLALVEQTKNTGRKSFGCGGSLISARYVLTAAHCVVSNSYKVTLVRLGDWNLDEELDCIAPSECSPPHQDIEVEETIPHEDYIRGKDGVFNDIALIRLARPAKLSEFVRPICLPLPSERSNAGDRLTVAGWGATENKKISAIQQKVDVPVVDYNSCKAKFGESGIRVTSKMVCAGGEKGKDSCKGDSGGPLIAESKDELEQYYIEGVVSFGNLCGLEGWPGIHTRVTDYLDWITNNIKP